VLDAGAGPGVSSRLLISHGFSNVVGLDPSRSLLKFASSRLSDSFSPVVGVVENLPFRDSSFAGSITCFSLRDVRHTEPGISEFARVMTTNSHFCIVDVGKPDAALPRAFIGFYIHHIMPRVAVVLIRKRISGNPFRMIVPTFDRLLTNEKLRALTMERFGRAKLQEFILGGLIIVDAERKERAATK
jgi:demethylmenaquinone methyltransferase / 2-methoxy-6-polyprenyl-1,4-benzoquinol methylase